MKRYIGVIAGIVIFTIIITIFILPLKGNWFVNQKYLYSDYYRMLESRGMSLTGERHQSEYLSIYEYWKIKRLGMLGGKVS